MSEPNAPVPPAPRSGRRRALRLAIVGIVVLLAAAFFWQRIASQQPKAGNPFARAGAMAAQPVTAATARAQNLPVWLNALGTVTPHELVNVMPRVSGLLQSVDYRQGQRVKAGQLLAQIDPQPFRIAVAQASAQLEQTQAQLAGAKRDLTRYERLLRQDSISQQQVSDQQATVAQLKATLDANRAALDNARLQLQWTRITAPISGLAGLRPVDAGNMVTTSGAVGTSGSSSGSGATPIATLAQVQPIDVTFAIPQQQIGEVVDRLMAGTHLEVQAWDARNTKLLATGKLIAADNQINTATGTLNLRAEFANDKLALFPNQFVNVRLLVRTLPDAVMVPSTAVAVGAPGTYVYVIGAGDKVSLRKVATGASYADMTQIVSGVQPGERVVTDGLDRLRDGREVRVVPAQATGSPAAMPAARRKPAAQAGQAD